MHFRVVVDVDELLHIENGEWSCSDLSAGGGLWIRGFGDARASVHSPTGGATEIFWALVERLE